ncbi:unnamed protein product [Discula destructiva]
MHPTTRARVAGANHGGSKENLKKKKKKKKGSSEEKGRAGKRRKLETKQDQAQSMTSRTRWTRTKMNQ